jgi:hypothetical protein
LQLEACFQMMELMVTRFGLHRAPSTGTDLQGSS